VRQTTPHEYQRQLRSLFATLRTLVRQTVSDRVSVEDFAAHLESRIGCLARAHDMLMLAPADGVDFQTLVCEELLAQAVPAERYEMTGPEIRINRESTAPLALALHELTLNASSHGAFGGTGERESRTRITWRTLQEGQMDWLQFIWSEHGMTLDHDAPPRKGFGFELLERMLPYELGARSTLHFTRQSLQVELLIPKTAANWNWQPAQSSAASRSSP